MEKPNFQLNITTTIFRSRRDELISRLTDGINMKRIGTKYKPVTERSIAIRVNKNPYFKGQDGELELLIKTCEEKGSYSKFFFVCPLVESKRI